VLHLNSVKQYLKETIPSDSLVVPFVTVTILKHEKEKEKNPPNILIHGKEIDCLVEVYR